jgi:flagellar hook-associated protein 2
VVDITARDGTFFSVNIDQNASLAQIAASIESASGTISGGPKISVRVNDKGTGLAIVDNTGGSSNLIVRGTDGDDTAAALGIATSATGVASASIQGSNLQRQYVSSATLLSSLNNGKGVGTGTMRLTDATGTTANITLSSTTRTVEDMIKQLNASGLAISASLNSQGDGIVLTSTSNATGKIKVEDTSGQVAKNLNLAGEAKGSGVLNTIDGSFERQIEFSAADSLSTVASKINSANAGVVAAIVNDGSTAAPFRLNLTASTSGASGRFQIDTNGFDLGLTTMQSGQDSRVFFGSSDPARGLLLTSSTNTVDNAIQGVKLDLLATTTSSVMINVSRDSGAIEAKIDEFITAYNALSDSIKAQSSYDTDSKRAGPLLGDGTTIALRQTMTSTIQGRPIGVTPRFNRVGEIGIKVAKDGKLEFNKDKFREAVAQDADSVERMLFARVQTNLGGVRDLGGGASVIDPDQPDQFSELGIFTQFEEMATRYIDSTRGILTGKDKSITSLTENISKQIAALDSRIASKRVVLQQQFLRMEKTIGRLQSQQSSLASMSG